ncbi:MAG: hypothetical protein HN742_01275 [Lentisphaerae bacterium]|nr:hypothetical protein [Lentisphaerota bacterium]MBT4817449.1 hypothetical protein [Lentisphaerota bacterium]MBT5612529.1 hypothetical protein [Lentisphaerota bacterium]MBT7061324.1 hypothetical protein [Lentisphaerota bacterium]MBT7840465.1 hypothetical protein [Lentisphaerota bacterium]
MRHALCPRVWLAVIMATVTASAATIDLSRQAAGELALQDFRAGPDREGVLAVFDLNLPPFRRAVYYQGGWWPTSGNRVYSHLLTPVGDAKVTIREVSAKTGAEGGMFAIFEQSNGHYLAVLPLAGAHAYAWFSAGDGRLVKRADHQPPTEEYDVIEATLRLKLGHHGIGPVEGEVPVCAWASGDTPYQAAADVWRRATELPQMRGRMRLREDKPMPEPFRYLGWCSWDCLRMKVTEASLVDAVKGLSDSDIPVRWALLDDGHYDRKSLLANEKFPNSYADVVALRSDDGIRWMGIWYAMFGNFRGTQVNPAWDSVKDDYAVVGERMMPRADVGSARTWFRHMYRAGKEADFDLLKTDFQTHNINFFRGRKPAEREVFPNPYAAAVNAQRAFHEVVAEDFLGLINCNWHNAPSLFHSFDSVVGRCSEDNRGGERDAITHTFHSFASTPWLGQVAWGDHDMFHSGDRSEKAAKFNVVAKAMSGSSICLSELAPKIRTALVHGLCYGDGLLLRPSAPGAPLAEDMFHQLYAERLMTAVAPLAHGGALFAVYGTNRRGSLAQTAYTTTITPASYAQSSGMIQPYTGLRTKPEGGLLVYDWYAGQARPMEGGYDVTLKGFDFRALHVTPIVNGYSVIGRTDKYLCAAAVSELTHRPDGVIVTLHESGPLGIWCEEAEPQAAGITFEDRGNGLFVAELPVRPDAVKVDITLKN